MSFVFLQFGRQKRLIAQHSVINKRNTGDPVAFRDLAVGLQVVLPSDEIPHEIAPVHEINLIPEEETKVFSESRAIIRFLLSAVFITHAFAFYIRPLFVGLNMASLRGIHAREEHAELLHIDVIGLITGNRVVIFFSLYFRSRSILGMSFLLHRYAHVAFHAQFNRSIVSLAVEERSVAILLTV